MATIAVPETVTLPSGEYMRLLVRANDTDPSHWPEGARQGAELLVRIRQIEADCRTAHGKWDWELISEELQDEYDSKRSLLDRIIEPDPQYVSGDKVFGEFD